MRYLSFGSQDGRPLLLVHGWALTSRLYRKLAEALVDAGYHVILPAQPGHASSPEIERGDDRYERVAERLWAITEALHLPSASGSGSAALPAGSAGSSEARKWTLLGHSQGGPIALHMSDQRPDEVEQLILLTPIGGGSWRRSRINHALHNSAPADSAAGISGVGRTFPTKSASQSHISERPIPVWLLSLMREIFQRGGLRMTALFLMDALPNIARNPKGIWHAFELARSCDVTEIAQRVAKTTSVVAFWARTDWIVPIANGRSLAKALRIDFQPMPGGHIAVLREPANTFLPALQAAISRASNPCPTDHALLRSHVF